MRELRIRMLALWVCVLQGFPVLLVAQINTLDFIYGGIEDAEKMLQEYIRPTANIIGAGLNAGWYNTARPHKLGGLDVMATVSWAKAPRSALSYDLSLLNLNASLEPSKPTSAPTAAGEQAERPELIYTQRIGSEDIEYARFTHPDGSGYDFFPLPMGQITVGLPLGTDVSARFIPVINVMDFGEVGLWGVGGKHSVSQWIPILRDLDFLDISLQGGYTRVSSSVHLKIEPQEVDVVPLLDPDYKWEDQFLVQKVAGWTVNLIASQTLLAFTFYEGIGYASSLADVFLEGHYPVSSIITAGPETGSSTYEIVQDPISLNFSNYNNLRVNAGLRVALGIFTLHYDLTHTVYFTHSVGVGFTFR